MKIAGILKLAATGGALLAGGPAAAIAVGGSLMGGDGGKKVGKILATHIDRKVHRVTGPVGALGLPALLLLIAQRLGIDTAHLCTILHTVTDAICNQPELAGVALSLATLLGWHMADNAQQATDRPSQDN